MLVIDKDTTFLFLPSLSLQSDIPLPGLGDGVEQRDKEGEEVRSLIGGAGEGVGVGVGAGVLVGDDHPGKAMVV